MLKLAKKYYRLFKDVHIHSTICLLAIVMLRNTKIRRVDISLGKGCNMRGGQMASTIFLKLEVSAHVFNSHKK